jgi:hypothetical protein
MYLDELTEGKMYLDELTKGKMSLEELSVFRGRIFSHVQPFYE